MLDLETMGTGLDAAIIAVGGIFARNDTTGFRSASMGV